jgi:hypothetical protein
MSTKNLPTPPRDPTEPPLDGIRPEYTNPTNFPGINTRNRPQLIPRPASQFIPSGYYDVLFPAGTAINDALVIAKARQDLILVDNIREAPNVSNIRAASNIFKPDGRIYPRANGGAPPPPPGNYNLVFNYNVNVNDLSNAGTNY